MRIRASTRNAVFYAATRVETGLPSLLSLLVLVENLFTPLNFTYIHTLNTDIGRSSLLIFIATLLDLVALISFTTGYHVKIPKPNRDLVVSHTHTHCCA